MPDEQPRFDGRMKGTICCFLTVNKFRVELRDRQLVDAVMPDDLMEKIRPYYSAAALVARIGVVVEFRPPPAMQRIVEIVGDGFIGEARAARR